MKEFISVVEARSLILGTLSPMPTERVTPLDHLGRTLAESVRSRENIPPFANSAMDGFAVRVQDVQSLPSTLRVIEEIPAGSYPQKSVEPGTCARIMTGAPFPEGADAVAPVEWTEAAGEGKVRFNKAPEPGEHVRVAGQDAREGELMFEPGQVITPPVVGMLATLGYPDVAVYQKPRVAVISTGDELVDPASPLGPGQIRDSNGPALAAQVCSAGGDALPPLHARDTRESIRAVIEQALDADMLLFSGGVSVGDYDLVKQVLDDTGMELFFWKVRQRPGKPLAFGMLQGRYVFGLPGNSVSSAMCFEQYVRPALAKMLGRREVLRPRHAARLAAPTPKKKAGLHYFARGIAFFDEDGCLRVRATGPQGSNLYSSVVRANCIFHMPEAMKDPADGAVVHVEWLLW
ncbi:MAG: gephyrin-like molybdotransferase Glp [Rhodothermales bacterium]